MLAGLWKGEDKMRWDGKGSWKETWRWRASERASETWERQRNIQVKNKLPSGLTTTAFFHVAKGKEKPCLTLYRLLLLLPYFWRCELKCYHKWSWVNIRSTTVSSNVKRMFLVQIFMISNAHSTANIATIIPTHPHPLLPQAMLQARVPSVRQQ